jgi:thiol-disulfide isomerase/thioredoxin
MDETEELGAPPVARKSGLFRSGRWILYLIAICAVVIVFAGVYRPESRDPLPKSGKYLPPVPLYSVEGKPVKLDLRGKNRLVVFWATWCGPCRMETPGLKDIYDRYAKSGFEVTGISTDEDGPYAVKPFLQANQIRYPIYLATREATVEFGGVDAIPAGFLVNKRGEVVRRYVGYHDPNELAADIEQLLKNSP